MSGLKTTELFIKQANAIHNSIYDYSQVNYIDCFTKIIIICKIHGPFIQGPTTHLQGHGCQKCAGNYQMNSEEFIDKANKIHKFIYDYSKTIYYKTDRKVIIICMEHGEFKQTPHMHLDGNGCPKCGRRKANKSMTKSHKDYIREVKKIFYDKYDYSETVYINGHTKIVIKCKDHGYFYILPYDHLGGSGCPKCGKINSAKSRTYTNEYIDQWLIINSVKLQRIDNYINSKIKIKWKCLVCNIIFDKNYFSIREGKGCPECSCTKKNERKIFNFLNDYSIKYEKIIIKNNKNKYYPDFYISELNLIIEYQGLQHYQPVRFGGRTIEAAEKAFIKQKERDEFIRKYCKINKINLLEIDGRIYTNNQLDDLLKWYFKIIK
jgi:hypothetical protein